MKKISLILLLLTSTAAYSEDTLYSVYSDFRNTPITDIKNNIYNYFNKDVYSAIDFNDPQELELLSFSSRMKQELQHFETTNTNRGCLTITGNDQNNEPMAFNITYSSKEQKWVIQNINVLLADVAEDLPQEACCPDKTD